MRNLGEVLRNFFTENFSNDEHRDDVRDEREGLCRQHQNMTERNWI